MNNGKVPTVSQMVGLAVQISAPIPAPSGVTIKPDFDTDVLWKPVRLGTRSRTVSVESSEGEAGGSRRISIVEGETTPSPRTRKLSFSEMIFGAPGKGGFSWGQSTLGQTVQKESITDDERFKELLKRESNVLNDDCTFSRKMYMKQ